jgi:hypothetical protein
MAAVFKPGDEVPSNGIYRVEHESHRLMHMATLPGGRPFPQCQQCGNGVRFELVREVEDGVVISNSQHTILENFTKRPHKHPFKVSGF